LTLPIRTRLTVFYTLFMALMLVALGGFLVLRLRSDLNSTIDQELRASSRAIANDFAREGAGGFREISAAALHHAGSDAQVLDSRDRVLVSYGGDIALDPMLSRTQVLTALGAGTGLRDLSVGDADQPYRVLTRPVGGAGRGGLLAIGEPLGETNEAVSRTLILLLVAGPIALAVAGLAGWWLVRNALLPVDRIRRKTNEIEIDRLDERLSAPHPHDEIGQLVATLNAMLDRLESGVSARRQLIADASHELRTPLAAMRAELDVTLREIDPAGGEHAALLSVREEVDRMSRTVDNLLTLARADGGALELLRGTVELDQAAQSAAAPLQALATSQRVRLRLELEPVSLRGDAQQLRLALTNVIENAIKFTPPGGEVTITTWAADGEVGVTVTDTGPGIPAAAQPHVFDRFYRADASRSRDSGGSGLGLAITAAIAAAHGGRVWVDSGERTGSAVSIGLPVGAPSERIDLARELPG
jgi:heavy metal sensor kinase